jgi:hypothetical protein
VYLGAIAEYLPSAMVRCISNFIEACYIAQWNAISLSSLDQLQACITRFHELRDVFIASGVRKAISLPCQHALVHYPMAIQLFGSPNGLCSSITELKHIEAIKDPWHWSSRFNALYQILRLLLRLQKLLVLHHLFSSRRMLRGTTTSYMAGTSEDTQEDPMPLTSENTADNDGAPIEGVAEEETLSIVTLSGRMGACVNIYVPCSRSNH